MAIEDIIWGKNNHIFGGMAPSNMLVFTASLLTNDATQVEITARLPLKTTVNGQTLCTVAGVVIRKKIDGYPKDEFDGELVIDHSGVDNFTIRDTIVEGETVCYSAFPYSKQGVYNRNAKNRAAVNKSIAPSGGTYLYGFDLDTTSSDPGTRVTYPSDVDNSSYTPAVLNNLNDWNLTPGKKFMPRPCMLKYDGSVDYYLNPDDYTKKVDGTASDVSNSSYSGNAMMEWPKIYTKRWESDGVYHFRCSDYKIDDDYECWCNYDENNNEIDHFYTGIYRSSYLSEGGVQRHKSISGTTVSASKNLTNERTYSQANGSNWDIEYLSDHLLIQDLLVLMGKSTDTQSIFGVGGGSSTLSTNGLTDKNGLFYGTSSTSDLVKIFGMEDYWGVYYRRVLGLFMESGGTYAKITKGTKDGSSIKAFNTSNVVGYINLGSCLPTMKSGYISAMKTYSWGRLPISVSGSKTTYECDYYNSSSSSSDSYVASIAGYYGTSSAEYRGAYSYSLNSKHTSASTTTTSRLSYKPTKS